LIFNKCQVSVLCIIGIIGDNQNNYSINHTHTHTQPFYAPFSRTT